MLARITEQVIPLLLVALAAWVGIQWLSISGYKLRAATMQGEIDRLEGQVAVEIANNATLQRQIEYQNAMLDEAAARTAAVRRSALSERDRALADLRAVEQEYTELRSEWPEDCESAVDMARQEFGL